MLKTNCYGHYDCIGYINGTCEDTKCPCYGLNPEEVQGAIIDSVKIGTVIDFAGRDYDYDAIDTDNTGATWSCGICSKYNDGNCPEEECIGDKLVKMTKEELDIAIANTGCPF